MLLSRAGLYASAGVVAPPVAEVDYVPTAAVFDGGTDALYRIGTSDTDPLVAAVDGKLFSCAFTIKRLALSGNAAFPRIVGGQLSALNTKWAIGFEPSDHATVGRRDCLFVEIRTASSTTTIAYFNSTIPFVVGTTYRVGISVNRATRAYQLRVDNIDRLATPITDDTDTSHNIDFTTRVYTVGARVSALTPTFDQQLNAELTDLSVYFDRAIDWSSSSEWGRFFEAGTHALQWKAWDGSKPYAVSPIIYQSGAIGQWPVNRGYGGGFTLSGALAASASPPAGAAIPQFDITGFSAVTSSDIFLAPGSDNWPTTWLQNNAQLTVGADGGGFGGTNDDGRRSLFVSRLNGAAPSVAGDVSAANVWGGKNPENAATFNGKSYGIVAVGGTVYMAVGLQEEWPDNTNQQFDNAHLYKSTNNGASWTDTGVAWNPAALSGAFSLPTFLCCGRANGAAFDAYVYMFASGNKTLATGGTFVAHHSQHLYLARAPASSMEAQGNWEYYTGVGPTWSTNIANRQPVPGCSGATSADRIVCWATCVAYIPEIDRCLYLRNRAENAAALAPSDGVTNFEILTAQRPWGPWTRVALFNDWRPFGSNGPEQGGTDNRYNFTFYLPPRWIGAQSGSAIPCKLVYSGSRAVENERFDAWQCTSATLTLTAGPALSAPVNTGLPSISPTNPAVGQLVTASNGTWTGNPAPTFTYQWLRNGANIGGATAQTYVVTTADRDAAQPAVAVRVTATNSQGSASATSAEISIASILDAAPPLPTNTTSTQTVSPGVTSATINGFPANTRIRFNPGTYTNLSIVPKDGQWFEGLGVNGIGGRDDVILTSNLASARAFSGSAKNVFIQGLTIKDYAPAGISRSFTPPADRNDPRAHNAAIEYTGTENDALPGTLINWTTYQCRVTANYGRGINVTNGDWVSQTDISDNAGNGGGGRGFSIKFTDCDINNNNRWDMNKGNDAAGIKFGGGATPQGDGGPLFPPCKDIVFRRCKIHDNNSHGIWTDWDVFNVEVDHCSIYANAWGAISAEVSAAYWVHHCQIGDNLRGVEGNQWLGAYELNWQSCKKSIVEDNLFACYNNENSGFCYFSQHQRSGNGSFQGGVYIGHFTCTENTFRRNVILQRAGASAAAPADFPAGGLCTWDDRACTGTRCMQNCGTSETGCALLYQGAIPPGGLGGNAHCFVPASTAAHFNVAQDNTWRSAGTPPSFPGGAWGSETGRTTDGNPDSFLPNWSLIPTWTVPPGKLP